MCFTFGLANLKIQLKPSMSKIRNYLVTNPIYIYKFIRSNFHSLFFYFFFRLFRLGKHLAYALGFNIRVLRVSTLFLPELLFQFLPFLLENRLPFLLRAAKRDRRQRVQIFVIFVPLVHKVRTQVAFGPRFHFARRTCEINTSVENIEGSFSFDLRFSSFQIIHLPVQEVRGQSCCSPFR